MKLLFSPRFMKQYRDAPLQVQKAFDKQAKLLVSRPETSELAFKEVRRSKRYLAGQGDSRLAVLLHH
jgi:mRNA-degrading endonuclease RelE of RelBE toxin-antitoxin system